MTSSLTLGLLRRDIRKLYVEASLYGLLAVIPSTFLSVYALRLGASNQAIGLLTALPALVNVLWLVPSARLIERQPPSPALQSPIPNATGVLLPLVGIRASIFV